MARISIPALLAAAAALSAFPSIAHGQGPPAGPGDPPVFEAEAVALPAEIPPGVPVILELKVRNTGRRSLPYLGNPRLSLSRGTLKLRVREPSGRERRVDSRWKITSCGVYPGGLRLPEMAPGESVRVRTCILPLTYRFSEPGRYEVRAQAQMLVGRPRIDFPPAEVVVRPPRGKEKDALGLFEVFAQDPWDVKALHGGECSALSPREAARMLLEGYLGTLPEMFGRFVVARATAWEDLGTHPVARTFWTPREKLASASRVRTAMRHLEDLRRREGPPGLEGQVDLLLVRCHLYFEQYDSADRILEEMEQRGVPLDVRWQVRQHRAYLDEVVFRQHCAAPASEDDVARAATPAPTR